MDRLFMDPSRRVYALYGNTGDYFYTPQLRELEASTWLLVHLKSLGYQRITYYSPNKKIHFLDVDSARLARSEQATSADSAASSPSASVRRPPPELKAGPMGFARMRGHRPVRALEPPPVDTGDIRLDFGAMTDAQAISALDRMMREAVTTALVFQNGEDLFSMLDQDALRHWDNTLGEWVGSRLSATSRNLAILIFRDEVAITHERLPRLRKHLFGTQEHQPLSDRSFRVGPARQDEVKYLLHRLRLQKQIDWTPLQIDRQSFSLAQSLIPESMSEGIKSMSTLAHEVCAQRPQMLQDQEPWAQLRQRPNLADRVEEKLHGLVKEAKSRLARHRPVSSTRDPHQTERLSITLQPDADKLANLHLALLGSPGTGKTTLARLIARIYRAEGILSSGHLVEVKASNLIEDHVGGTAKRTAEAISRAMGGILFIDEAYGLVSNQFGPESITELVKAMTDHNGQFAVIVAGYTWEITDLIEGPKANPGLRRRFPKDNRWELRNYGPEELHQIFIHMLKVEGYDQDDELRGQLHAAFAQWVKSQDPERFGNAGEVKNLFAALTRRAGDRRILCRQDFAELPGWRQYLGLQPLPSVTELLQPLDELVGLQGVRTQLEDLCHGLHAEMRRTGSLAGHPPGHYAFIGNAGTGKTVVARLMGRMLHDLGLLNKAHVHEISASQFVGSHVGEAEQEMREALRRAQDGILFIDEAHQLRAQGQGALNVLVPEMENRRQQLCVILAGYPDEMRQLLAGDQGLESRLRLIQFDDYGSRELQSIAIDMLTAKHLRIRADASDRLRRLLAFLHANRTPGFGNARTVRELIDREILPAQARRIALDPAIPAGDARLFEIEPADIPTRPGFLPEDWEAAVTGQAMTDLDRILQDLDQMIGLREVKEAIGTLANTLAVQQRRGKGRVDAGHYLFSGHPGTGKTTVARLMGRIFRALGLLTKGHVVEVKREDLIGRFQGDAEANTKEKIQEALDGVLFIDEAYQLVGDEHDIYGRRVIETLLANMENYRHQLCVILAGYPDDMRRLLGSNPGFSRRFKHRIDFPDYSADELRQIALAMFAEQDYRLTEAAIVALSDHLQGWDQYRGQRHFGNAGDVRNLIGNVIARQSTRLRPQLDRLTDDQLSIIDSDDIPKS